MRKTTGPGARAHRLPELAGAPPQLATSQDFCASNPPLTGRTHAKQRTSRNPTRINLKMVTEALIDQGLDPAAEITRILRGRPVLDDDGNPVIDQMTGEPIRVFEVDPEIRLRTLNEILQYTQPKLKAVEVKMSGSLELTNEQLDKRLESLLAKALK